MGKAMQSIGISIATIGISIVFKEISDPPDQLDVSARGAIVQSAFSIQSLASSVGLLRTQDCLLA